MTTPLNWYQAAAFITLAGGLLAAPALALEETSIGDTQMCINSHHIRDTPVIDGKTILVKMRIPKDSYKRIDLVRKCAGLHDGRGFAYSTSLNKLCKQDSLVALGSGGAHCFIDKIVTIDKAEALELMKR
jgi:hypothetical protein